MNSDMESVYRSAVTKMYAFIIIGALFFTGVFIVLIIAPFMWDAGMTTIEIVTALFYLFMFWILKRKMVDPRIRKLKEQMKNDNSTPM